jgi:primosomal protein N' (replication factor Y)
MPELGSIVLLDEHDEVHKEERTPAWHARDVVVERARRSGATCVLVSPSPTLEALAVGGLITLPRPAERAGWPAVDVVDIRREDPAHNPLISERLVAVLRSDARVVCVVNRKGRSRLLLCRACGEVARCERCDAAVSQDDDKQLACSHCGTVRPPVCKECGGTAFRNLRVGVTRLREELEALVGEPVGEVTGDVAVEGDRRVIVGTEAVLHAVRRADVVAFLDLDQELLVPRARAAEQALTLLIRGARLLGGRGETSAGRLLLQTRVPRHEVVQAAVLGDPSRVTDADRVRREELHLPPFTAVAAVSGASAPAFIESFGSPLGVEVLGPSEGRWLLRAPDHRTLCDALAATPRPSGRVRIEVDPLRA